MQPLGKKREKKKFFAQAHLGNFLKYGNGTLYKTNIGKLWTNHLFVKIICKLSK